MDFQLPELSNHIIAHYQSVLPVLVIENIPSDQIALRKVSAHLLDNGWCWVVCGRRLFVWHYKHTNQRSTKCYELQLPASDVAHRASLVCLLSGSKSGAVTGMPSVLAVSPEGTIRYWANLACEGNCFELQALELQGQECTQLISIQPHGCLLGTTTASLMHIQVHTQGSLTGQPISCRLLRIPQGILAGIRKISTFIFSGLPIHSQTQPDQGRQLVKVLAGELSETDAKLLYALAGLSLQCWEINKLESRFRIEYDLDRCLRDEFIRHLWSGPDTHPDQIQVWVVDSIVHQNDNERLVLLVAGVYSDNPSSVYFALCTIGVDTKHMLNQSTATIGQTQLLPDEFTVLRNHNQSYDAKNLHFLDYQLLPSGKSDSIFYFYDLHQIICVQLGNDVLDCVYLDAVDNAILGAGICDGNPLLFTSKDSFISLVANDELITPTFKDYVNELETSADEQHADRFYWIRRSFNFYRKNENQKCQHIIRDNYNQVELKSAGEELDQIVVLISRDLCDGTPRSDPRWAESSAAQPNEQLVSVYLANQLEEKLDVHCKLIEFLKEIQIWDKLNMHTSGNRMIPTQLLLCEHAEKLVAANAFKKLHDEFGLLLDAAIKIILERRNADVPANLTIHDIFYRELSKVDELIPVLFEYQNEYINSNHVVQKEIFEFISAISIIFITVFREVSRFRQEKCSFYESSVQQQRYKEFVHWSASAGQNGIRTILLGQVDVLTRYGIETKLRPGQKSVDELQVRTMIYEKVVQLTDIILDGYICQLRSLDPNSERFSLIQQAYENDRAKCIKPLLKSGQYDRAISLAEKYEDFDTMIYVCEALGKNDRLKRYLIEFKDKNFATFLFKWYLREGKQSKLMSLGSPLLGNFLTEHPDLHWLHQINTGDFKDCSSCLIQLANKERKHVKRKKALFSIAKLSALAGGADPSSSFIEQVNREHKLIAYQEMLQYRRPELDVQRPLNAKELIRLFIDATTLPKDEKLDEIDFKNAYELTVFIDSNPQEYEILRREIISTMLLQDIWTNYDTEDPILYIQNTVFINWISILFSTGTDYQSFLPTFDDLMQWEEIQTKMPNPNDFAYLIKIAYENFGN